ncbi:MAG: DUF2934 domain-containing protein [Nitrospira sp.]|nr:DUF2934 domain-containing protein [Nitrospira sp.]MDH4304710.1 DUF2934 domain-containing protein [Nitrospira sp.]MDH5194379.1 DUF2934 domain-containing protein [Nitrospira sp.]
MARRVSGEQKEAIINGRRASVARVGRTLGPRRADEQGAASVGAINGSSEAYAKGHEPLHQQIAERAYILYERSGFQDGNDVDHWLEAERQIKGVRSQAA